MKHESTLNIYALAGRVEQQNMAYREALLRIAEKAQAYHEAGNGQGGVLYRMAMDALFPGREVADE